VSSAPRARVTKASKHRNVIDVDEQGRVVGFRPARVEATAGPAELAGNPLLDPIPDREDLERVARGIADIVLVPIEIVTDLIRKIEGLPFFALVAYVLYKVTTNEITDNRRRARGRR